MIKHVYLYTYWNKVVNIPLAAVVPDSGVYGNLFLLCKENKLPYNKVWRTVGEFGYYADGECIVSKKPVRRSERAMKIKK